MIMGAVSSLREGQGFDDGTTVLPVLFQALFPSDLAARPTVSGAPIDGAARIAALSELRLTVPFIRLCRWMLWHADATALQLHLRGDVDFHGL